ncbi:transposable element Tcb1 transposase [Trichonephila clavipes]|nr:transposable element Tcb1 transposase [Trichonephila clavipes]
MANKGVGNLCFIDGIMAARTYTDVLRDNLPQSAIKLGISNSNYFQQDNDPKHTAGITRMWLLYHVPRKPAPPPQSPDLNPLENLWNSLDLKIIAVTQESLSELLVEVVALFFRVLKPLKTRRLEWLLNVSPVLAQNRQVGEPPHPQGDTVLKKKDNMQILQQDWAEFSRAMSSSNAFKTLRSTQWRRCGDILY